MGEKVKLDLGGINLVKPALSPNGGTIKPKTQNGTSPAIQIPSVIKPDTPPPTNGSKFLQKAQLNRNKSFQDRLAALPNPHPQVNSQPQSAVEFATAVMRGMGWREGEPCRPGGALEATVFVPLPEGVGLGFHGTAGAIGKGKPTFVRPVVDGVARFTVGASDLIVQNKIAVGERVSITDGDHGGLSGLLVSAKGEYFIVKLDVSRVAVSVSKGHLSVYSPSHIQPSTNSTPKTSYKYPTGSVCLMRSKTRNPHLYYRQVVVVDNSPLLLRSWDDGKTYTGHHHDDLLPSIPRVGDTVICLLEHFGKVGQLVHIDHSRYTVLSDSEAISTTAITKFSCI